MLVKFEFENFKNFQNKTILDLSNTKGYEFNNHLIKDGIIRGGVIFGINASGKSNVGYAIFDIVNNLTDNNKTYSFVAPYKNLNSKKDNIKFKYVFKFNDAILEYEYAKIDIDELAYEKLKINGTAYIEYDYENKSGFCKLKGTESLNVALDNNKLSFVKYINNNSVLEINDINSIYKTFLDYVEDMLLFYSLENKNRYIGYKSGGEIISDAIVKTGNLKNFEEFLNRLEIKCKLISREVDGKYMIYNEFQNGEANFYSTASTGTKSLALFYYWLIHASDASLIFMDEFDAYYHFELAEQIVKEILNKTNAQVIFTSHNNNLMNNDLFRPDCLFILQDQGIKKMSDLTDKELRKAHNLQKMYKAGAFDE